MLNRILKSLKRKKKSNPARSIYAVLGGTYGGSYILHVETLKTEMVFYILDGCDIIRMPSNDFHTGVEEGLLDLVETLPQDIYDTCYAQYKETKKSQKH